MAAIAKAGAPLLRGVGSIAVGVSDTRLRAALLSVTESLSSGESLADAFTRFPMLFGSLFVAIVRVGEACGGLDRSFHERQRNLKRELSKIKKVEAVMCNPTFVVVAMVLALVVSKTTLIPAFTSGFDRFGSDLPC